MKRRTFIQTTGTTALGAGLVGHSLPVFSTPSPNETIRVAVMGTNSRGAYLADRFAKRENTEIVYICDPEDTARGKGIERVENAVGKTPKGIKDFRQALDDKDIDLIVIAAPDHWHAPAALMAMQAGKHVYVEKPCGHNPREGEMLINAKDKYGVKIQMGNQQRSDVRSRELKQMIDEGALGEVYFAKAFYANGRGPIGNGKQLPVPSNLDWELWQGPAPHVPYRDNIVHYNWHWFWRWGTGEACNNGTHEIDVARWMLGVDYPIAIQSSGGRYHFNDDWEFYDTQYLTIDCPDNKSIVWEGRSCNPFPIEGKGRGCTIHGTKGTALVDRSGYMIYDMDNNVVKDMMGKEVDALDTQGAEDSTSMHIQNLLDAIREDKAQNSPIEEGHKSVLMCHLGNIAQKLGRRLDIDHRNGRIMDDSQAMKYWGREYEIGWEMSV